MCPRANFVETAVCVFHTTRAPVRLFLSFTAVCFFVEGGAVCFCVNLADTPTLCAPTTSSVPGPTSPIDRENR